MYDAKFLKQLAETKSKEIIKAQEKDMRAFVENVLDARLYAQALFGQNNYRIEIERIPCNMGMLMNYLSEHGYCVYIEMGKIMIIKW